MNNLLQKIMITDFVMTGAVALLQILAAGLLAPLLGISSLTLQITGVILILFVSFLGYLIKTNSADPVSIKSIIVINILWAIGCFAFIFLQKNELTNLGLCFVFIHIITVLGFAFLQNKGFQRAQQS